MKLRPMLCRTSKTSRGPYISFEHVYKSFGEFVVLEDVSFFVFPGETLCILGAKRRGKVGLPTDAAGFSKAG